jgi:hypothetical protein
MFSPRFGSTVFQVRGESLALRASVLVMVVSRGSLSLDSVSGHQGAAKRGARGSLPFDHQSLSSLAFHAAPRSF